MKSAEETDPGIESGRSHGLRFIFLHPSTFPGKRANIIQVAESCSALAALGNEVFLVVRQLARDTVVEALEELGVAAQERFHILAEPSVRIGQSVGMGGKLLARWRMSRLLRSLLKEGKTVLYLRTLKDSELCRFLVLQARKLAAPLIYEAHKIYSEEFVDAAASERALERIREREDLVLSRAAGVVASHPLLEQALRSRSGTIEALTTIPNGVRPLTPERQPVRFDAIYAGSLYPWKGVNLCLEAAARLDGCRLAIVGGSPAERLDELRIRAAERGIAERVTFYGQRTRSESLSLVAASRVALVPLAGDTREGDRYTCPLKMLEAMALGVPVVASDTPAIRSFLDDGVTGLLAKVDDEQAMADAIATLLTQEELSKRVSRNARIAIREYTYAARAERVEQFALELLAAARRA